MTGFLFESAPFPSCHASTVCEVSPGRFVAAWFGGTAEKAKDVKIWLSRGGAGGWTPPETVAVHPGMPTWNPVLFVTKPGELTLWYKAGPSPDQWTGYVMRSADGGTTWGTAEMLPAGFFGPVRAKPLALGGGHLLAGTSVESYRNWTAFVDHSEDAGRTWRRSNGIGGPTGFHQIQPALFRAADGTVVALMRSANPLKVCRSESRDGGRTWTPAEPTAVPNPSAGVDVVRVRDGTAWMICNPVAVGRSPLSLLRSTDAGRTWQKVRDVESAAGEYSYPALIETADGRLAMTYTWKRTRIAFQVVDV
jgi:predicted neuraminidase